MTTRARRLKFRLADINFLGPGGDRETSGKTGNHQPFDSKSHHLASDARREDFYS
jgi:hypothetical protein